MAKINKQAIPLEVLRTRLFISHCHAACFTSFWTKCDVSTKVWWIKNTV